MRPVLLVIHGDGDWQCPSSGDWVHRLIVMLLHICPYNLAKISSQIKKTGFILEQMNISKALFLFTILLTTSTLVIAQAPPDGSTYKLNKNGLVISTPDSGVIYLGKDCDAYSKKHGKGV